ncbi:MAG: hypothetical protein RLZZ284_1212, partial [Actinomycetota bacterium]
FFVEPRVEHLQEDPLRPAVELLIGGADAAASVVRQAESPQLSTHVRDVRLGVLAWVNARRNGVLLGRQTERVIAQRVQHVEAGHALEPTEYIGGDVAEWVADVQTSPRWVGEHIQDEKFLATGNLLGLGQRPGGVRRFESAG